MTDLARISFVKAGAKTAGTVAILADADLAVGKSAAALGIEKLVKRAAVTADFKGKAKAHLDLIAPADTDLDRLIVIGVGKAAEIAAGDWINLGGATYAALAHTKKATVLLELPGKGAVSAEAAADFALGIRLRAYAFDNYRKADEDERKSISDIAIAVADPAAAKAAWASRGAIADGVLLARDLVNEPPNVLGPVEFAERVQALKKTGLAIDVLTEKEMGKLGMNALIGVAQGSSRPPRLVVMRWNGGKAKEAPVAFVGKGVVFDSGGISIKPAASMEDMKGDMAGAAAVTGLMRALAARKAKANVVGILGLVENMPDGKAQRPGDIVKSASGQTIEVINTDAEGRLVLADALWYVKEKFDPALIVDLATLTGAILVALGQEYAGLFSNDDELAGRLSKAGEATGEKLWRMPMGAAFDKLIDSRFADMKNTGGRHAGSITAAQFLARFVDKTPWAHLDIAGTGMGSPAGDINQSWASGWGVRLLDRLVRDNYES